MWKCVATIGGLIALCAASATQALAADPWPTKPLTLIVPFAAGGSTDVTGRMLAARLRAELGQSVVVENRGGAGGNIGADAAAKATPDGHTVFLMTSTHVTNISLYKKLSYDLMRDFQPVTEVAFIPNALVVANSVPVNNLAEFVKFVQDPKNTIYYGSAGNGSSLHVAGALFNSMAKGHMIHVPYKGSGPAIVDLLGGQIQAIFSPLVDVLPHIKAGKIKALGITTKARSALFPELQAIGEVLPGYEITLWNGLLVPAKTPSDVVAKLNEAVVRILHQPEVRKLLAEQGSEPVGNSPAEFRDFIASEVPKWRSLVEVSGAKVE